MKQSARRSDALPSPACIRDSVLDVQCNRTDVELRALSVVHGSNGYDRLRLQAPTNMGPQAVAWSFRSSPSRDRSDAELYILSARDRDVLAMKVPYMCAMTIAAAHRNVRFDHASARLPIFCRSAPADGHNVGTNFHATAAAGYSPIIGTRIGLVV